VSDSERLLIVTLGERSLLGQQLAARITQSGGVRDNAQAIMPQVVGLFPEFTPHQLPHLDAVIDKLSWIIPEYVLTNLNEYEIYFLIAAGYLHDVGMIRTVPDEPSGPTFEAFKRTSLLAHPDANDTEVLRQFVRSNHHLRSEEFIREHGNLLGLGNNRGEWQVVARIAAGHRKEDLRDADRFGKEPIHSGVMIHTDLLAGYLRLADELDITQDRTPTIAFDTVNPTGEALKHWAAHLSVSGIAPDGDKITVRATCTDYDVHLLLLDLQAKIQNTIDELQDSLPSHYELRPGIVVPQPIPFHHVEFKIESIGYRAWNLRFQMDVETIAEILTSPLFYSDRTAAIRELLQNAVDACRLRMQIEPRGVPYEPRIDVEVFYDGGNRYLRISDNGYGMSESNVRRHLAQVGRSFYRSEEFSAIAGGMHPIGHFGLGLLSVFMLGKEFVIETRQSDCDALRLEIRDPGGYIKVVSSSRVDIGTEITVKLNRSYTYPILPAIEKYATALEIPIFVVEDEIIASVGPNQSLTAHWTASLSNVFLRSFGKSSEAPPLFDELSSIPETTNPYWAPRLVAIDSLDLRATFTILVPDLNGFQINYFARGQQLHNLSNQGILIQSESNLAFAYEPNEQVTGIQPIRRSYNPFNLSISGAIDFKKHPSALSFARDRLIDSEWTRQIADSTRETLLNEILSIATEAANTEASQLLIRTYLYQLLIEGINSGIGSYAERAAIESETPFSSIYSVDESLTRKVASVYGRSYPIAWLDGPAMRLATLEHVVATEAISEITVMRADPGNPILTDEAVRTNSRDLIAVIDSPREFDLIKVGLLDLGFRGSIRLKSGWEVFQDLGFTQAGEQFDLRLVNSIVVESDRWNSDILLGLTDFAMARAFVRDSPSLEARTGFSPSRQHPIILLNARHPFVQWMQDRDDALYDAETVRRFVALLIESLVFERVISDSEDAQLDTLMFQPTESTKRVRGARQLSRLVLEMKSTVQGERFKSIDFRQSKFRVLPEWDPASWPHFAGANDGELVEWIIGDAGLMASLMPRWSGRGTEIWAPFQPKWWRQE